MLPDANRLRKQKEIERVKALGSGAASAGLRIKSISNGLAATRFCFVVSSAVAPRAVDRNQLKRRLREAARVLLSGIYNNYDIVVWLQRMPSDKSYAALLEALKTNFGRSGLFGR